MTFRVKGFESCYDKIRKKSYTCDFFNNVEDLAGVRVVCIYFADLERINSLIDNNFIVIRRDRKTLFTGSTESGYLSDHYIVKLSEERKLASDAELMELKCEIQVRTQLMHAWATVSHELFYKKEIGFSENVMREMVALSSLLYVADQRFDAYKKAVQEEQKKAAKMIDASKIAKDSPMTSENLAGYLRIKFPSRKASGTLSYEQLSNQLNEMGLTSVLSIDKLILKASNALLEYEKEHPPRSEPGTRYDRIGAARISVALADSRNKDSTYFYVMDLDKFRKMVTE